MLFTAGDALTLLAMGVAALSSAFVLRGEMKRTREVLQELRAWLKEHERTLDDHGNRIARVEGVLGGDHWMRQPHRPARKRGEQEP